MIKLSLIELNKSNDFSAELDDDAKVISTFIKTESLLVLIEEFIPDEFVQPSKKHEIPSNINNEPETRVVKNAWD